MTWYERTDREGRWVILMLVATTTVTVIWFGLSDPITIFAVGILVAALVVWSVAIGLTQARRRAARGSH